MKVRLLGRRSAGELRRVQTALDFGLLAPAGIIGCLVSGEVQLGIVARYGLAGAVGALVFAASSLCLRSGGPRRLGGPMDDLAGAFAAWGATVAAMYLATSTLPISMGLRPDWHAAWAAAGLIGLAASRAIAARWLWRRRRSGSLATRVAVVGSGERTARLLSDLRRPAQRPHYELVGLFDDDPDASMAGDDGVVRGRVSSLAAMVSAIGIDLVIAAPSWEDAEGANRLCRRLRCVPTDVLILSPIATLTPAPAAHVAIGGCLLFELCSLPLASWRACLKRFEDIVLSALLLVTFAPVMAVIPFLIRLETPGPAIFRQLRFGFANRPILVPKFRTMVHDDERSCGRSPTLRGDVRVTKVGRFLRRTSLDELPQLFSVLRGEMSLVGPRAHPVEMRVEGRYYGDVVEAYATRHLVRPGITGLAQINGQRGLVDTRDKAERRVDYDLKYIETWSIALDLWILYRSIFVGFMHENAY